MMAVEVKYIKCDNIFGCRQNSEFYQFYLINNFVQLLQFGAIFGIILLDDD